VDHPYSALSVTMIKGGLAINAVPGECELKINCRYIPDRNAEKEVKRLGVFIKKCAAKRGIRYELKLLGLINGHARITSQAKHFNELYKKYYKKSALHCALGTAPYATWAKDTLKLEVFGTGVITPDSHIHGKDESVKIRDIEILVKVLKEYLTRV
jgi:acetylornithine deacetylase/succinyl-diaminopimelate desuccinylase-like protein